MTYFADLTPHTYSPTNGEVVLNVGWLDAAYPFGRGQTSREFHDALRHLCERPIILHRGFHVCHFCPSEVRHALAGVHPGSRGNGQVRVKGAEEVWWAAPTMIHHYVTEHEYLPPEPFIE